MLEMPNGTRAALTHNTWSSSTLGLANLLERLDTFIPSPADGDPEYARAYHVAAKVSGRIALHAQEQPSLGGKQ